FILQQLNEAAPLLNGKNMSWGRITWGATQALKLRVLLYNERWDEAIAVSDGLLGKYSLHSEGETPYFDLFSGAAERANEIILSKVRQPTSGAVATGSEVNRAFVLKGHTGGDPYVSIVPTGPLVDSYPMANGYLIHDAGSGYVASNPYASRDPRLAQTIIYPTGKIKKLDSSTGLIEEVLYDPEDPTTIALQQYSSAEPSPSGYVWNKYTDWSAYGLNNITDCGTDLIIFRYAEVLLSRAEALLESRGLSSKAEVCDLIDQLRNRVGAGLVPRDIYSSLDELRHLVRNERRIEMAGEGLRYWDLLRWKIAEKNVVQNTSGMEGELYGAYMRLDGEGKNGRTVSVGGVPRRYVETRFFTAPKNYLNPIPQAQIDLNPGLIQNEGW
ncbi:MAG: RagB/SusD family nutrient uptake outer membrane protein, partial [Tannerellaceae bacterium]|nr:RagB/SusD family nutrient uptake outer membrane protein [Tannerellaceae bacterium]